jgi:hypothetical protein
MRIGGERRFRVVAETCGNDMNWHAWRDQHLDGEVGGSCCIRHRAHVGGGEGDAVMAKKKITLQVITDALQHGGNTYANGQQFEVTEAQAKELLKTGQVVKAS